MGRSIYCSTCKKEKETGRENESRCKQCKSQATKAIRAKKRSDAGLPSYASGRKAECSKCGKIKENQSFGYCHACNRERENEYRIRTGKTKRHRTGKCRCGGEIASYSKYLCSKCATAWKRNYFLKNPEKKIIQQRADSKSKNAPDSLIKILARQATRNALRRGLLKKSSCEVCGEEKTEAHHDDYSKPFDVRWLCTTHHAEHHIKIKELNGD